MNQSRNPHYKKNGGGPSDGRDRGPSRDRGGFGGKTPARAGAFHQKSFRKFSARPIEHPPEHRPHGEVTAAPKKTIADFERQFNAMNTKIDTMLRLIQEMSRPAPTDDGKPRY